MFYREIETGGLDGFQWQGFAFAVLAWAALNVCLGRAGVLVAEDDEWRYFKGFSEASSPDHAAWRQVGFDDSPWDVGRGPFYYENGSGFAGNTPLTDMYGGYTCVFLRKAFTIAYPEGVTDLTLSLQTDDGCVVWLNGVEVKRVNMADGEPLFNGTSLPASGDPNVDSAVLDASTCLRSGANVLAIQAFNVSLAGSTDFLISAALTSTQDATPPLLAEVVPMAGPVRELRHIEVVFDENVTGVDAADLRINGQAATGLAVYSPRDYGFDFSEPPEGTVTVSWAPDAGITDLATPPNAFAGQGWSYILDHTPPPANVIISEFLAVNDHGIRDNFGHRSDWIELLNLDTDAVDLSGWYLTDDPDEPTKWRFPAVVLGSKALLLVWASEDDQTNPTAPLHTNFKLDGEGDYLALVDPNTNVLSAFSPVYPAQRADISYGRDRSDPSVLGYFPTPTPGAANSTGGTGFAPEPVFSLPGGVFPNPSLSITLSAPSGTIRYTVNGAIPTESSTIYSNPITVTGGTVIQARVFQAGLLPSAIVTQTYNLIAQNLATFSSNLPLLIISTAGKSIGTDSRIPAFVTAIETVRGRASLTTSPQFQGKGQIEIRGQSSTGFPKKAYNLELNNASGFDLEVPLLGLPAESDWVLYAPYSDKPFLHNYLAFELHEKMGHYAPRRRFVEVFVDTNGGRLDGSVDYAGIYILLEKIKVDANRVDVARLTSLQNAEPEISGGYIIKKDKDSPGDSGFTTSGGGGFGGQYLKYHDPKPREITAAQKTWIRNYLNQFEQKLYATTWLTATGTNHYSAYIDVDSFVDNHWIVEFPKQIDGYRLSNYMHKDRNGKFKMDPIWDWNLSFGNADYLDGQYTSGWYYSLIGDGDHPWLRRLICGTTSASGTTGDPNFKQRLTDRWSVLRTNILSSTNLLARIDELAAYLNEAQVRDFQRWPRLGSYVWPNPPFYSTPTTYAGIIASMKSWVQGRFSWIDSQFLKTPVFNPTAAMVSPGFQLAISAATGTLYFTVDGTDPRASGGGLAAAAQRYTTPLAISANCRVVARTRLGTTWSGPAATTFLVEAPPLLITELMWAPPPPASTDTSTATQFEYVELANAGSSPLDLRGFRFVEGIQFEFSTGRVTTLEPGARVVVAQNEAAFVSRYGMLPTLTGQYTGALANEGERLRLVGPMEETVQEFDYDPDWYPATDGLGFALIVADEQQAPERWSQAQGWRTGQVPGGTPGQPEPPPARIPRILVNEVLTQTDPPLRDSIELFNPEAEDADIGGWYLSDDRETPKFRIPLGTVVRAGNYVVFTENDFNPHPGTPPSFGLGASGDDVFLTSADATGHLTGYQHGFGFGPALGAVSFGRHMISTGAERLVLQEALTLGTTNSKPRVGPVVISEIMYHPTDVVTNGAAWDNSEEEFIELLNLASSPVALFDPTSPACTWRLRDAVSYPFPTNTTLAATERVLVVSFDPGAESAMAAAFRIRYGLGSGVRLFGPFDGKLANNQDKIELVQPDAFGAYATNWAGTGVVLDEVEYEDASPWPLGADGIGFSLQRRVESDYGDDPINWIAAAPTPGQPLAEGSPPVILRQPESQTVPPGTTVTLSVDATADLRMQFQWRLNGNNIQNAISSQLILTNIQPSQAGRYQVNVRGISRSTDSAEALVQVAVPPTLVTQPTSVSVRAGHAAALSVVAYGTSPLRYQWRKDGVPIPGATRSTLDWTRLHASDAGSYEVVVSDQIQSRTSAPAQLTVLFGTFIAQHPVSGTGRQGDTATLSVAVRNNADLPISCQWMKNGAPFTRHVVADRADFLTLANLQPADAGAYEVVITNQTVGTAGVRSDVAWLQIVTTPDQDNDGMPDDYENQHGLDKGNPADAAADADQDGASNHNEYTAGTDPHDPDSVLRVEQITAGGSVVIRFRALACRTYTLLGRDRSSAGAWTSLAGVPALSSTATDPRWVEVLDPDATRPDQRFYRIVTPGLPRE